MRRRARIVNYKRAGYGWLSDGTFIHICDVRTADGQLPPNLSVGQEIEFELANSPKGVRAVRAVFVNDATTSSNSLMEKSNELLP